MALQRDEIFRGIEVISAYLRIENPRISAQRKPLEDGSIEKTWSVSFMVPVFANEKESQDGEHLFYKSIDNVGDRILISGLTEDQLNFKHWYSVLSEMEEFEGSINC